MCHCRSKCIYMYKVFTAWFTPSVIITLRFIPGPKFSQMSPRVDVPQSLKYSCLAKSPIVHLNDGDFRKVGVM